nr:hypothetical protein [Candidatus Gracilibacteria bacterium]
MKKSFIFFLVFLFFTAGVYSLKADNTNTSCKYQDKIDECFNANQNGDANSIEDYICAQSSDKEEIAYQIILDLKFKEIDKEAVKFLDSLQKGKDYYFGPNKQATYIDGINYINEAFGKYGTLWKKYKSFCDPTDNTSIIKDYLSCSKYTTTVEASQYFTETECMTLVEYKLNTFKKIAYNVLGTNKLQVMRDYRKKQFQTTRTMYDNLIDNMNINLDDITKINNQWNYKTQECK